jgi:hypothetical protein
MKKANRASLEFSLIWQSDYANHKDRYFASKVDFWRDILPGGMEQHCAALHVGERYREVFHAGVLVPPYEQNKIIEFKEGMFERDQHGQTVVPKLGRFYPKGFALKVFDCFRESFTSFRLVKMESGFMVADTNHPLANFPITLEVEYVESLGAIEQHGGVCNDIADLVTKSGPGMQIPYPGVATDFYSTYPFPREDEGNDTIFYSSPRLINHLDNTAIDQVESIYSRLISSGSKILDLMSSWVSHLPDTLEDYKTTGLGLNEEELKANKQLSGFVVYDLNQKPELPFDDNEFDAVICTASIEYLTQPIRVITEVARVTKPGGVFISTFSDRWFPGKEIMPWSEMHPFERLGLVLDYYRQVDVFENLYTESVRGLPRPSYDRHIQETVTSDPIFAVWGSVKG